jgi:hypothetical protein
MNKIIIIDDVYEKNINKVLKNEFLYGKHSFTPITLIKQNYKCICGKECKNEEIYCNDFCKNKLKSIIEDIESKRK